MFGIRDLLFALLLHLLLVAVILASSSVKLKPKPQPLRTIQVSMVSLKDLQAMMPQEKVKPPEPEVVKLPPPAKVAPQVSPPPQKKPKKAVKKKAKKKVVKAKQDPNYDPFAPLASTRNKPKSKSKPQPSQRVTEPMVPAAPVVAQLSSREIDRYILGMQRAVERKWKVPIEVIDQVRDAYVELQLHPTGMVLSVKIIDSSGSSMLDNTLIQAIYAAAPFAIPAKHYDLFRVNRIRFFPLQ